MIAGETETILSTGSYDPFLFFGKGREQEKKKQPKKEQTPEEREARKVKRKQFWSDLGGEFEEGGTISNILTFFGVGNKQGAGGASDYQIGFGQPEASAPEKGGLPTGVLVIGGLVLLGAVAWGVSHYQRNRKPPATPAMQP